MSTKKPQVAPTKTTPAPAEKAIDSRAKVQKTDPYSFDQVSNAIQEALCEAYPPKDPDMCGRVWPRDVFDSVVVFSNEGQLMAQGYSFADGKATLSGAASPVRTAYVALNDPTPPAPGVAAPGAPGGVPTTASEKAAPLDLGEVTKVAKSKAWFAGALEKKSPAR